MSANMSQFSLDRLTLQVTSSLAGVLLTWDGVSEARNPDDQLGPFLRSIAADMNGRKLTIDFQKLKYINSATLSTILTYIRFLDSKQVQTLLRYDTNQDWQRVAYRLMKVIVRSLTYIAAEERPVPPG